MQKLVWVSLGSAVVGFMAGLLTALEAFEVDVDLLGIPYMNTPVVADQDLILRQGSHRVEVPKGSVLVQRYVVKDEAHYALEFVGLLSVNDQVVPVQEMEPFWLESASYRDTVQKR